ncbi:plasmid replication protein, partial [Streptococcus dysgalactiae]
SLLPADWLKLLDPLNKSYLSARYKNKLVIGRLIVITNYQSLKSFFGKIQNEDLNQYIRRFNNVLEISKKKGNHDNETDRFYNLSEVKELNYREYYQPGYDQEIQLHFVEEGIYCTDNKADFIHRVLDAHILPR